MLALELYSVTLLTQVISLLHLTLLFFGHWSTQLQLYTTYAKDRNTQVATAVDVMPPPIAINPDCYIDHKARHSGELLSDNRRLPILPCRFSINGYSDCCDCAYQVHFELLLAKWIEVYRTYKRTGTVDARLPPGFVPTKPPSFDPKAYVVSMEADNLKINKSGFINFRCYVTLPPARYAMFTVMLCFFRSPKRHEELLNSKADSRIVTRLLSVRCGHLWTLEPLSFLARRSDELSTTLSPLDKATGIRWTESGRCIPKTRENEPVYLQRLHHTGARNSITLEQNTFRPVEFGSWGAKRGRYDTSGLKKAVQAGTTSCLAMDLSEIQKHLDAGTDIEFGAELLNGVLRPRVLSPFAIDDDSKSPTFDYLASTYPKQRTAVQPQVEEGSIYHDALAASTSFTLRASIPGPPSPEGPSIHIMKDAGPTDYLYFSLPASAVADGEAATAQRQQDMLTIRAPTNRPRTEVCTSIRPTASSDLTLHLNWREIE